MNIKLLDFYEALAVFNKMPEHLKVPSLSPEYIICDKNRNNKYDLIFWHAEKDKKEFLHAFYKTYTESFDIFDIESPYGYGGPISNTSDKDFISEVKKNFIHWCKINNIIVEFLKLHPLVNHFCSYWGVKKFNRQTVCINLEKPILDQYRPRRQKDLKEALKISYTIKKSNKLKEKTKFKNLYIDYMKEINANKFYLFNNHYFKSLLNSNICDVWLVYYENQIVCGSMILGNEKLKCVEYHLSATVTKKMSEHLHRRIITQSNVFMLNSIAEYYKKNYFKLFYLGGGTSTAVEDSLLFFKKGFSNMILNFDVAYYIYDKKKYSEIKNKVSLDEDNERLIFYR